MEGSTPQAAAAPASPDPTLLPALMDGLASKTSVLSFTRCRINLLHLSKQNAFLFYLRYSLSCSVMERFECAHAQLTLT